MSMPPEQGQQWLPSGFPPRSFPPGPPASNVPTEGPAATPAAAGRGRWLGAIAGLVALLLLAGGLFAATRGGGDDDDEQLATGPTSSEPDTSVPAFDTTTTAVVAATTTPSIEPVTTAPAQTVTTPPPNAPAAGVLEVSTGTLVLPKTDATVGATRGNVTLRNVGGSPLSYTVQSSVPSLTAAPARGNLNPGTSLTLTVNLDAARIPTEGPFSGTLSFGGTGGARTIQVTSVTGRPPEFTDNVGESCTVASTTCSRQIKLGDPAGQANPSPCNTPWAYAITITDQSQITSSRAIARRGVANADAALHPAPGNIFVSNSFSALPPGTVLRFALEAIDAHGFGRRLPEQTIAC